VFEQLVTNGKGFGGQGKRLFASIELRVGTVYVVSAETD